MNSLTLYDIESRLAELLALRDIVLLDDTLDEPGKSQSLAAIDKELEGYFSKEIRKVDGIANAIRSFQFAAGEAAKEAERLRLRALRLAAVADRIKASSLAAMQTHGITKVETPNNTLRIQGNGGLAPLVIDDAGKISARMKTATLKLNGEALAWLKNFIGQRGGDVTLAIERAEHTLEPDGERIRAALKEESVEGAHLAERGSHLRLS